MLMEKRMKSKLLCYGLLSFVSFVYLVLPENVGVSMPVFAAIQLACLYFLVPDRKSLWKFIPVVILSLNAFISGNEMWRVPNLLLSAVLYSVMLCPVDFLDTKSLIRMAGNVTQPFKRFSLPFRWSYQKIDEEKGKTLKRVVAGLLISAPVMLIIIVLLSSADSVFSKGAENLLGNLVSAINPQTVLKILFGLLVGLYLFGLLYNAHQPENREGETPVWRIQGDLIILNILLVSILVLYTVFIAIQFRYLFAGAELPFGLTYTEYARKGFFELLLLTGVNVFIILLTVWLTREKQGSGARAVKVLCYYLCAVTIVLLVSSFYRMWLYNADDGLTRLRFLVFGFLIFECLGLVITFFYIWKPKFNIIAVYLTIALVYYLLLNIVPVDYFVAKSQVDRYLRGDRRDISYVMTLSSDAAPQVKRLLDTEARWEAEAYFERFNVPAQSWQGFNLSRYNAKR